MSTEHSEERNEQPELTSEERQQLVAETIWREIAAYNADFEAEAHHAEGENDRAASCVVMALDMARAVERVRMRQLMGEQWSNDCPTYHLSVTHAALLIVVREVCSQFDRLQKDHLQLNSELQLLRAELAELKNALGVGAPAVDAPAVDAPAVDAPAASVPLVGG